VKTKTQRNNNKNNHPQVVERGLDYNANDDQDTAKGGLNSTLPLNTYCNLDDAKGCAGCTPSQCQKTDRKCLLNPSTGDCLPKCKSVKDCVSLMPGHEEKDLVCHSVCLNIKPCDLNTTDCESCELSRCQNTAGCKVADIRHDWDMYKKPKCFSSSCNNDKECHDRTGEAHYVCLKGECKYADCDLDAKGCSGCTPYQCEDTKDKCKFNRVTGKCEAYNCESVKDCVALSPGFKEEDFVCNEYGHCENIKPCEDCESCDTVSRCRNQDGCHVAGVINRKVKCISPSCDNDKECHRKTGTEDVICLKGECKYDGCRKDADCLTYESFEWANATLEDVFCHNHTCEVKDCNEGCPGCSTLRCEYTDECFLIEGEQEKCISKACKTREDCRKMDDDDDMICLNGQCEYAYSDDDQYEYSDEDQSDDDQSDDDHSDDE